MLDWRYLTTIPDFIGESAAICGGDLYLSGYWGPANGICDRLEYAPVVRIGRDGSMAACYPWPADKPVSSWGEVKPWDSEDRVFGLAAWQDGLYASGQRWDAATELWVPRLARFDGMAWQTEAELECLELVPQADCLAAVLVGGVGTWDRASMQTVATGTAAHLVAFSDERLAWISGNGAAGRTVIASKSGRSWSTIASEWPSAAAGTMTWYNGEANALLVWREKVWACSVKAQTDGTYTYALAYLQPGSTTLAWVPVLSFDRERPMRLCGVRNRIYAYEGSDDYITDGSCFPRYDGTWWEALYDGRSAVVGCPAAVIPYRVLPLENGGAVAFCRSQAHRDYVDATLATGLSAVSGYDFSAPDTDTLVYVVWPKLPGPVVVPYGALEGTVTDDGAAPLEEALVATGDVYDETDAAGQYLIPAVAIGRHTAAAAKAGYVPQAEDVSIEQEVTTEQDFALPALTTGKGLIWGFVRDGQDGSGLELAGIDFAGLLGDTTATAGVGGFYSKELDPDTYALTGSFLGYICGSSPEVLLAAGDVVRADLFMYPDQGVLSTLGTVTGTVRDLVTGLPLEDVLVEVGTYQTMTDAAGYYRRKAITAGTYAVALTLTGYTAPTGLQVVVRADETTRADFGMVPDGTGVGIAHVTVTAYVGGAPIQGAKVTLVGVGSAMTGATGEVTIGGVPAGTYTVLVESAGYYPDGQAITIVASTTTDLSVTLNAPGAGSENLGYLWGLVRDQATRDPLSGASVAVSGLVHPDNAKSNTTNAAGFYLVMDLYAGTEEVVASLAGYHTQTLGNVPVSAGIGTRLDIALVDTGTALVDLAVIGGYVADAVDQSAVARAEVWLDGLACVYSADDGAYAFGQVLAGLHELDGSAVGFYPTRVGNVPAAEGETTEVDIPLWRIVRLGSLVVTVEDADGNVLADAEVALSASLRGTTGPTGTVTFADVPEGWYNVLAWKGGYVPGTALVEVSAGGESEVTITITAQEDGVTDGYLVGYVIDQWTRMGIRGATVEAADGATVTGLSGQRGAFSLALAADTYVVTGSAEGYLPRWVDAVVAANECTWLTLALLPGWNGDSGEHDFVGVPSAAQIPEGGPASVLITYEGAGDWQLAISTNGAARFRRAQIVPKGIETTVERSGTDVRILARKVSGEIGGIAASLRP